MMTTSSLLIRSATYLFAIVVLLLACRLRRLPPRDTLGLHVPSARSAVLYSFLFVCLAVTSEWLGRTLGIPPAEKWREATLPSLVIGLLSIVVVAPVAEEL